ncbi:Regulator of chromosome condensation (RCC1) repeat protein [Candidatus Hepatoplasma crinochetorum Av]|uniref:Regulator of chromosome condensation (RCC1) repeat protein n=1 Tax=Candidatus Hepatoplasma crinochetorum Av TaxID=1427984 RepID=W8GEW7_9MOLU|nr:hypothetical protein [Candidatus Hepatoplasma crinochetorum]AHK22339.1 Regulator of chromosome condensation (RCC1) repeat protein [Candidatus Hepatoplasma crinochetorum Av]
MKKNFIFSILLFLITSFSFKSFDLIFDNKNIIESLDQNVKVLDYEMADSTAGVIVDTDSDYLGDTLYMWGLNSRGQIGDGTTTLATDPKMITPTDQTDWGGNLIQFESSLYNSGVTVDTDYDGYADTIYIWGDNQYHQIFNDESESKTILFPTLVLPSSGSWNGNIIDFFLGDSYVGILLDTDYDGFGDDLYTWGNNNNGELGNGTTQTASEPVEIFPSGQTSWNGNITDIYGYNSTFLLLDTDYDGYADTGYSWGNNSNYKLGINSTSSSVTTPTEIVSNGGTWNGNILDVSSNSDNSMLLLDTNFDGYGDEVYLSGTNYEFQLGIGGNENYVKHSIFYPASHTWGNGYIIDVSMGKNYSVIIVDTDLDGYADAFYGDGYNSHGQLGTSNYAGSRKGPRKLTKTFDRNDFSSYYKYNFMQIETGTNSTGILVDTDLDGYGDTLYMSGANVNSDFGNSIISSGDYKTPIATNSTYDFLIQDLYFDFDGVLLSIDLKLNDYQNIFNEETLPTNVLLIDDNNISHQTIFEEDLSNITDDQYHYKVEDIEGVQTYIFKNISINDNIFNLNDEQFSTDYLISDYQISNISEQSATINLNFENNSEEFDLLNYTSSERKIKVNYTDLDQNISNSQEFVIDDSYEITLINLNAESNYQIDSIQYFYQDENYKHTIDQEKTQFQTSSAIPLIESDSIKSIDNSITTNSFQYTILIDNLKLNQTKDNFTQYDINNGIWLIDENNENYNSTYINAKIINSGSINGTGKYQLTFKQDQLIENTTYNFIGISFDEPSSSSDPNIVFFSNVFSITTASANKEIIPSTFSIIEDSITKTSFQYTIEIDNLFLIEDSLLIKNNLEAEINFSNFNLDEGIYLIDDNGNIYNSFYVNDSSLYLGEGKDEGTSNYQFTFEQNNLEAGRTYNFVGIGFTDLEEDFINFDSSIAINTVPNNTQMIVIIIIIIILIIILLLIFILLFVDLKMKKNTKKMNNKLNNPNGLED